MNEAIVALDVESSLQHLGYYVTSIVGISEEAIEKSKAGKSVSILNG